MRGITMSCSTKLKMVLVTLAIYLTCSLSASAEKIIDATEGHTALLGTGFDSLANDFTENRCVRFDEAESRPLTRMAMSQGNLTVGSNLSAEDVKNYLYGSINASYPIFPGVNLSAEIEFERDFAQSDFTQTVTILYRGSASSVVGAQHGMILGEGPNRVLQNNQMTLEERTQVLRSMCGDRFVKGIESGIVFIATLQIKFDSEYDKRMVGGTLVLELFKMSGALAKLAESLAKIEFTIGGGSTASHIGVSINLNVYQHGGYPERLLGLLPEPHLPDSLEPGRAISCTYENRELCFRTFVDLLNYASQSLPEQLESLDGVGLAPLSYLLEEYEHPDLEMLSFSADELAQLDAQANELSAIREQVISQLNRAAEDRALVSMRLKKYGKSVPEKEILYDVVSLLAENTSLSDRDEYHNALYRAMIFHPQIHVNQIARELEALQSKIHKRESALQNTFNVCFDKQNIARCRESFQEVIERIESGNLAYDETILRIVPTDFDVWCRMTAHSGSLTDNERRTTLALMHRLGFDQHRESCKDQREADESSEVAENGVPTGDPIGEGEDSDETTTDASVSREQEEKLNYYRDYGCACVVTNNHLYTVDEYDLSNKGLTSIRPILSLPYVKSLNLSGNNLTNEAIAHLTWLGIIKELDLSDNLIDDLSPFVAAIVPRASLDLRRLICEKEDDADGYSQTGLETDVYQVLLNRLGDDYCVRGDEHNGSDNWETSLKLAGNRISDLSPMYSESWSWDHVDLSENHIRSVKTLQKPVNLRSVDLSRNRLDQVGTLAIGSDTGAFRMFIKKTGINECPFTETEEQSCVFE